MPRTLFHVCERLHTISWPVVRRKNGCGKMFFIIEINQYSNSSRGVCNILTCQIEGFLANFNFVTFKRRGGLPAYGFFPANFKAILVTYFHPRSLIFFPSSRIRWYTLSRISRSGPRFWKSAPGDTFIGKIKEWKRFNQLRNAFEV